MHLSKQRNEYAKKKVSLYQYTLLHMFYFSVHLKVLISLFLKDAIKVSGCLGRILLASSEDIPADSVPHHSAECTQANEKQCWEEPGVSADSEILVNVAQSSGRFRKDSTRFQSLLSRWILALQARHGYYS